MEKIGLTTDGLYKKYYSDIHRYILTKIRNTMDAEEIASEVFVRCDKHLISYNVEKGKVTTWLYTIAKRLIIDHYRKVNENLVNVSQFVDESGKEMFQFTSDDEADSNVQNSELMTAINRAMSKLNNTQRKVAIMYFIENEQYDEIANVLEIPLNSVKVTIHRIREALQKSLINEYAML